MTTIDLLIVGGGGGGGGSNVGGGGGAGGVIYETGYSIDFTESNYSIVVGAGAARNTGGNGEDSVAFGLTAVGGGGGGSGGWNSCNPGTNGKAGGSGGGGHGGYNCSAYDKGGSGTTGQGNKGGDGLGGTTNNRQGGGGGGAGGEGADAAAHKGGDGGAGVAISITGTAVYYGGGGGGGNQKTDGTGFGVGGSGIGGNGGSWTANPGDGAENTGSGGGGRTQKNSFSGAGGSGVVIIRYLTSDLSPAPTGGTVSYDGAYTVHVFSSSGELVFPGVTGVRAVCDQPYDLIFAVLRQALTQPYGLTQRHVNMLAQVWGMRLLAMCSMPYGSMPVRRARLNQVWGSARRLRSLLAQEYGEAQKLRALVDQLFGMRTGVRALIDQDWAVAEKQIRTLFDEVYKLQDKDAVRAILDQLYVMAAGEAIVQRADITVTAELDGESRELTSMVNIFDEQDKGLAAMTGELQLIDQEEYLFCRHLRTRVVVDIDWPPIEYIVVDPRKDQGTEGTTYIIPLKSPTILLDHTESAYSRIEEQELSGMRKDLVVMLSAGVVSVDWRLANTYLPPGRLQVNGRSRLAVIKDIVDSLGGIVQSAPSGALVCRPAYPQPVNRWQELTPDLELTDQDDLFQVSSESSPRPGYNRYLVSDNELSADGIRIESESITPREQLVRGYLVPWDDGAVSLEHSGGAWVQVVYDGVAIEQIEEQVEIVAGTGNLEKPFFKLIDVRWRQTDLGTLSCADDGSAAAAVAGNSLALVTYCTRYHQFRVFDDRAENVQVWLSVDHE